MDYVRDWLQKFMVYWIFEESEKMTPTEKIDAALDSVLAWIYPPIRIVHKEEMREAMRKIMVESYINGSNAAHEAMKGK